MAGENELNVSFDEADPAEEEIVVSIGGDGGAQVEKKVEPVELDPVEDLKSQFTSMQQRTTEVERENEHLRQEAQQASQRAHALEGQVVNTQLGTVITGLEAAKAEADAAEREYATAFEAGDGMAMARAQRKMAAAEARALTLEGAKEELEATAKRRPAEPQPTRRQPPQASGSPVERFIAQNNIPAKSAAWIRRNPEVTSDARANARMMAAHNMAVAEGIEVESEDYFRKIDEVYGGVVTKKADGQQQSQRRPAAPAAGGGTGGGSKLNGGGIEVKLTPGEYRSATDGTLVWNWDDPNGKFKKGDPIGVEEFAKRKYHGKKKGLYDKSVSE